MKSVILVVTMALAMLLAASGECLAAWDPAASEKKLFDATVLISSVDKDGNMRMCTATAFERDGKKYRFLTVAHCVLKDGKPVGDDWVIFFGNVKKNDIALAKFLAVDAKYGGDGFAVFETTLKDELTPVIPIAERDGSLGEEVSSVSFPHIRPKQLFRGYVCGENQDFEFFGKNLKDFVFFQLYAAPGSSGAAVVSLKDGTILAIISGGDKADGGTAIRGIAISNFRKFWAEFKNQPKK